MSCSFLESRNKETTCLISSGPVSSPGVPVVTGGGHGVRAWPLESSDYEYAYEDAGSRLPNPTIVVDLAHVDLAEHSQPQPEVICDCNFLNRKAGEDPHKVDSQGQPGSDSGPIVTSEYCQLINMMLIRIRIRFTCGYTVFVIPI